VRERHARCFAERVVGNPGFGSAEDLEAIRRFVVDGDNHAAALGWALRRERHDLAMRLVAGTPHYWYAAPQGNDQLRWLADRIGRSAVDPV